MKNIGENNNSIESFSSESYNSLSQYISSLIDIPDELKNILNIKMFSNSLIDWISAVLIFLLIYLLRKQIIKFSKRLLDALSKKYENPLGADSFKIIHEPLKWKILLIGFSSSYAVLNFSNATDELYYAVSSSLNSIIIGWVLILFAEFLHKYYNYIDDNEIIDMRDTFVKLSITIAKVIIVVGVFISLLQIWGYDIRGLLASLGLVGMAIALAAKDSARHLFGSIMIFSDKPFKVGDWIKTDDVEGTIEEIGMRSTKVRTFAQALVSVPNGNLADSAILNWSKMGKRRIKMTLGLTYSTTSTQMQTILQEIRALLKNHEDIHQQTIFVHFSEFADSSLGVFCYFFTKTTRWGEYMEVRENIYLEIMKIVEDNNASFAFPSQSIYIEENK